MTAKQPRRSRRQNGPAPVLDPTRNARSVLERAQAAVKGFGHAFTTVRKERGVTQGTPKDEEQDLLRAAVVFAGAGLDSLLKQLVVDALPGLLEIGEECRDRFEEFVRRRLESGSGQEGIKATELLARVLCDDRPRERLIQEYFRSLVGSSLQSVDQLDRVLHALGLDEVKNSGSSGVRVGS